MQKDPHIASMEEGTAEFVAGSMVPTFPLKREGGALILTLYDQEGVLQELPVPDVRDNEIFAVWLRKFDRY